MFSQKSLEILGFESVLLVLKTEKEEFFYFVTEYVVFLWLLHLIFAFLQIIATMCMFLAGKVEETPRPLKDVIIVSYEIIHKKDPSAVQKIKQKVNPVFSLINKLQPKWNKDCYTWCLVCSCLPLPLILNQLSLFWLVNSFPPNFIFLWFDRKYMNNKKNSFYLVKGWFLQHLGLIWMCTTHTSP